ncbi:hypothetical protein LY76DRAFT_23742 [Colletotrichum caudatum]|nr:hypothetical protein LY76DRAFT_23742 [Colletotrichum caudatum]
MAKNRPLKCNCCGELGHKAGDCPNKPARTCHSCGSEDHINKDCPIPRCFRCNQLGHRKNECNAVLCDHCGQVGHLLSICRNATVARPHRGRRIVLGFFFIFKSTHRS